MKPLSLAYFSVNPSEVVTLSSGVRLYNGEGGKAKVTVRIAAQLSSPQQIGSFALIAAASHVVIIRLMGGKASFPAFDAFLEACAERREAGQATPLIVIHAGGSDAEASELAQQHSALYGTEAGYRLLRYITTTTAGSSRRPKASAAVSCPKPTWSIALIRTGCRCAPLSRRQSTFSAPACSIPNGSTG